MPLVVAIAMADGAAAADDTTQRCGDDGRLLGQLYGAVEAELDWRGQELECSGMPRPEGRGIRLRLADDDLALIIGIPDFERDVAALEYPGNVTLIVTGNGRFFSTPDTGNCLVAIDAVRRLEPSGERYSVAGTLYCVDPLPEINGPASVSIPKLRFSGLLDWSAS